MSNNLTTTDEQLRQITPPTPEHLKERIEILDTTKPSRVPVLPVNKYNLAQQIAECTEIIVSRGENVGSNDLKVVPLSDILNVIKTGDGILPIIEKIRSTKNDDEQKRLKRTLPYFNMGTFKGGKRGNDLIVSTEFIILDIDNLDPGQVKKLKSRLIKDQRVFACFISPRSLGLKIIFKVSRPITSKDFFSKYYQKFKGEFEKKYRVAGDPSTIDVQHPCFLSYDPELYVNAKAISLPVDFDISEVRIVRDANNKELALEGIKNHTSIYCPNHEDKNASAFVDRNEVGKLFVRCSACAQTWWPTTSIESVCRDYWSYETKYLEMGVANAGNFFMHNVGLEKVYLFTDAVEPERKKAVLRHVIQKKHIKHIEYVYYLGDVDCEESFYMVNQHNSTIEAHISAIPVDIRNNDLIEEFLEQRFGQYKQFIKEYMSVYCYTNHKKLPTLILTGDRSTGKNTFAEMLMEIFRPISDMWEVSKDSAFTPEASKKLIVADETAVKDKKTYIALKAKSGATYLSVNEKFVPHYKVPNNLNIIILSNNLLPIFAEREELPADADVNQFFVYDMPKREGKPDPDLREKLRRRIGNYIRTELKVVFKALSLDAKRYSITVPITEDEKRLFQSSISETDAKVDDFIEKFAARIDEKSYPGLGNFYEAGYLLKGFVDETTFSLKDRTPILRNLVKRKLLTSIEHDKKQITDANTSEKLRKPAYKITPEFTKRIEQLLI